MLACNSNSRGPWLLLGVLGIVLGGTPVASGQDPERTRRPAGKLFTFEMRDKPWGSVLEWLADQSGLPVNSNVKPTGTFTFIAPQGSSRQYSLPQIIDVLNESLAGQKHLLVRGERSFTIIPVDEKIDPAGLPRIRPEDLSQHGNTELVSVVKSLTGLAAADAVAEVKQMLGPLGQVVPLERSNKLLVQDTAGNLKRIFRALDDIDHDVRDGQDIYSYVCEYARAREAVRIIVDLLGDPRELPRIARSAPAFGGFSPGQQPPSAPAIAPGMRTWHITADERTNSVLIRGPAKTFNLARTILKRIDVPVKRQQSESAGTGTAIPPVSAEERFRRLDLNGDGVLQDDEMPESLRAERANWDTDRNGLIDLNEFKAYFQARTAQRQAARGGFRADQPRPARGPLTPRASTPPLDEKLNRLLERLDQIEKRLDRLDNVSPSPGSGGKTP